MVNLLSPWVLQTITDSIANNNLLGGLWAYYYNLMGGFSVIIVIMVLFVPLYIRPQLAEFTAVAYILVGYAIQDYIPGDVLNLGRVIMVVGLTAFFIKLWLGRDA